MPLNPFARLTDVELLTLRLLSKSLSDTASGLIDDGRLRGDDWQLPVDALTWQTSQLGAEIEARGLEPDRYGAVIARLS